MSRTIDDPLPDFVGTYEDEAVSPLRRTALKILTTLGHITGKGYTPTEEDKTTFRSLYEEMGAALEAWKPKHAAVAAEAAKIADDREYVRVMDALTKMEQAMMDTVKKVLPIREALGPLKEGGRRSKTKKGRRVRKGTRRGRKGHF